MTLFLVAPLLVGGQTSTHVPDRPGRHTYVSASKLPRPYTGKEFLLAPKTVHRPSDNYLQAPPGFKVSLWADGLHGPRWLYAAPDGDVFCAECDRGKIILLRNSNHNGVADPPKVFASGLHLPFGMALHGQYFYVANTDSVVRFHYSPGQESVDNPETVIADIPSKGRVQHWTRTILFNPSGTKMYLTIGSETNKTPEPLPRAAVWRYNPDGTGAELFVTGVRNVVGLAWRPGTNELWSTVAERDFMGEDLVPDYFTRLQSGQFYGWPWYYSGKHRDPKVPLAGVPKKPVAAPDDLFVAHSTPLGLMFYRGQMFPKEYRGDAFVAMRGSTNRSYRCGYKVVRIRFKNGKLLPGYDDFVTGWLPDPLAREVYGRPVGIAQLPDGSMIVSDETAGCIWRISYQKP